MRTTGQSLTRIAEEVKPVQVDHVVALARICQRIGITESINDSLSCQSELDPGTLVTAMILDTLSGRSPLYKVEDFVASQDTELLFGTHEAASKFNDDTLGRTLDRIQAYGTLKLFTEISLNAARIFELDTSSASFDTTSVNVWGNYAESAPSAKAPHITYGYSKDKRPDLKQFMVSMLCVEGNIPLSGKMEDGNASDMKLNNDELQRVSKLLKPLGKNMNDILYVADCKLVNKDNLALLGDSPFITRLPASYKEHEKAVVKALNADDWQHLGVLAETPSPSKRQQRAVYQAYDTQVILYGKTYRAIVIKTDHLDKRRTKAIEAQRAREDKQIAKFISKSAKITYLCERDAESALSILCKEQSTAYWNLKGKIKETPVYAPGPAPKIGTRKILSIKFTVQFKPEANKKHYENKLRQAGCFVMLTTVNSEKKTAGEVLKSYKQQYGVEQNFSFLKEPLIVNDTFLKKAERIEALVLILLLSLMVWNLVQRELRRSPEAREGKLNDLNKRPTTRPTGYLFMSQLSSILILKRGHERKLPVDAISEQAHNYLSALGLDETIFTTPPPPPPRREQRLTS